MMHVFRRLLLAGVVVSGATLCSAVQAIQVVQPEPQSPTPGTPPAPQPPKPPVPNLQDKMDRFAEVVADTIARAHSAALWRQKTAIQTEMEIALSGKEVVNATLTHEIHRGRTRVAVKNGPVLIHDGESTWITPGSSTNEADIELHTQVIPWLLAAPFRLRDRTVQPSDYVVAPVNRVRNDSFRLTFTNHAGAAAGDWRIIFSHPQNHLLHAIANVPLTASTTGGAASPRQCVLFDEYKVIEGVSLAAKWTIWNWENEVQGEPIGTITLKEIAFVVPPADTFDKPSDSRVHKPSARASSDTTAPPRTQNTSN